MCRRGKGSRVDHNKSGLGWEGRGVQGLLGHGVAHSVGHMPRWRRGEGGVKPSYNRLVESWLGRLGKGRVWSVGRVSLVRWLCLQGHQLIFISNGWGSSLSFDWLKRWLWSLFAGFIRL